MDLTRLSDTEIDYYIADTRQELSRALDVAIDHPGNMGAVRDRMRTIEELVAEKHRRQVARMIREN